MKVTIIMGINPYELRGFYEVSIPRIRTSANKIAGDYGENICIQSMTEYIYSFESDREILFRRTPNFNMAKATVIDNLNSFDHFMQIGKNKYLLEVKTRVFDNEYHLSVDSIYKYRRILNENDELHDYIILFTSLFGNNEVAYVRLSNLPRLFGSEKLYMIPEYKLEYIDIDFIEPYYYDREKAQEKFIKRVNFKRRF